MCVSGSFNVTLGWYLASMIIGTFGTACTYMLSYGTCPIGLLCGFAGLAIFPVALAELIIGIMLLTNPKGVGPIIRLIPFPMLAMLLCGDFASPIVAVLTFILLDEESRWYLEG